MADAAQVVEGMGADVIDINMGCPVPKIAKHHAGCSLMREPSHAASVVRAMASAVRIPVTVKMRAGLERARDQCPDPGADGRRRRRGGGRRARQDRGAVLYRESDWSLIARVAESLSIPVFGSGDCVEPGQIVDRCLNHGVAGVLVGRGALRNPWIFAQASASARGETLTHASRAERGQFPARLHRPVARRTRGRGRRLPARSAVETGCRGGCRTRDGGSRARTGTVGHQQAAGLCSWYTKGFEGGSQLRVSINSAESIAHLREIIDNFFVAATVSN
jgi:tRNA-dihydrouridine synthase B